MRFRRHQEQARQATRWLVLLFALTVLFTVASAALTPATVNSTVSANRSTSQRVARRA